MHSLRRFVIGLAVAYAAAYPTGARADYDMSGVWFVDSDVGVDRHWDIVQSAGTLSVTMVDYYTPPGGYPGTIDEGTGAFSIDPGQPYPTCGTNTLEGFVAADSKSFAATEVLHIYHLTNFNPPAGECVTQTVQLVGSRCGNGELDAGEECDDGNAYAGDCCSPTCTLDDSGTACGSDNDVCTDDVCDGAGLCEHNDNTAPCSEEFGCGTGNCAAGACVISTPAVAGTSCDLDLSVCTPDTCDGAGACAAAAPIDCSPCGYCDFQEGCVADLGGGCDSTPHVVTVALRADDGNHKKLGVTLYDVFTVSDYGDPTAATDLTLCLYQQEASGPAKTLATLVIPAGGTCGTDDCWQASSDGFRYKDRSLAAAGISSIRFEPYRIKIVGKKALLPLPDAWPDAPVTIFPKLIASDGVTTHCWYHTVATTDQTPAKYKGYYNSAAVLP